MGEFIRWYLQDRPSCCYAAPDDNKNPYSESVSPFRKGGWGDLNFWKPIDSQTFSLYPILEE